jgi:single-strand DNA-binding protein
MSSFNKVFLIGNLTKAPELKHTKQGTPVAHFALAVNRRYKSAAGEWEKETDFFNITAWGKLGEICAQHLPKGRAIHVEGRLHTSKYETADNQKRFFTEIVAEQVQFLGSRPDEKSDSQGEEETVPPPSPSPSPRGRANRSAKSEPDAAAVADEFGF